jgi:hypothetical protein
LIYFLRKTKTDATKCEKQNNVMSHVLNLLPELKS